tara:strand:+ start:28 stop:2982 length:2955 start_codon:yes stop_codon:yes gene_type:complete
MTTFKNITISMILMVGIVFSNSLELTNLDVDAGTVDVYMVNDTAVGGYQFGLSGVEMTGGAGGSSADAGFTISASATTLLAFSFSGATIPAGEGLLVTVSFDNTQGSVETCIEGAVVSDASGAGLTFTEGCIALIEGGGCTDQAACNFDADATVDDGSCVYAEPLEDCEGNFIGSKVQIIHASPTPTVDVYVDGTLAIEDFEFEAATPVLQLPTSFVVGIAPADGEIIAEFPFELEVDGSYVVVATGILGNDDTPFGLAADATTFGASFADQVGLHVYHGSTDAPAVDVCADGGVLVPSLAYGDFSGYVEVPAADYTIGIAQAGLACDQSVADFTAPLSGLGGGSAVVFASGFLSGSGDDPGFGLFAALQDGTVLELPAILPADVELSVANVTSDTLKVEISTNADMGGFQYTLSSDCDDVTWGSITNGDALDGTDFTSSIGATGIALGFSFTGAVVPAGTVGVLSEIAVDFTCPDATFEIAAATISNPSGQGLTVSLGAPFIYPAPAQCADGEVEGCDGGCYQAGSEPVLDDCGNCWTPYCYFGMGDFQYIPADECADLGGTWIGPGNPADPLWNANMDCAGVCGGDSVEDCAGECGGSAQEDACGDCGGDATDPAECLDNFVVDLDWTGVSQLTIFQPTITTLMEGDEIGIFDADAIQNSGDCSSVTGETLVGAGLWTGGQLEVVSIGSVDNCAFGGFQLPGYQTGNEVMIKVYRDGMEYTATATYSAGTGTFGDLFMAISELELEEPNPPFYSVDLDWTGVSQLTIFQSSISSLDVGDEIGIFDSNAMLSSGDCGGVTGPALVGAGVWTGEQLEVVSVGSVDNCAFGGFQLPGYQTGNSVEIRVLHAGMEYSATATWSAGTGTFGDLFMAVSELTLGEVLDNDDVWFGPESYTLSQNYPNPFNPVTQISFDAGISGEVSIIVYDILGNKVKTIMNGFVTPGNYVASWDATDESGNNVSSGVYIYSLVSSEQTISKRMLLVK